VLNQITWLRQAGVEIDVVGTTKGPDLPGVRYFVVNQLSLIQRLFSYVALRPNERFKKLVIRRTDESVWDRLSTGLYSHLVLNDLDFVPLLAHPDHVAPGTHVHLDLHEYFPGTKGPLIWEITQRKYLDWLIEESRRIVTSSNSTVSAELCSEYQTYYPGMVFRPITNAPQVGQTAFEPRESRVINVIYHGNTGKGRSLVRILWAFRTIGEKFTLTYMLVCSPAKRLGFKLFAWAIGLSTSFRILNPVKTSEITKTVEKFDLGIMMLPPVFRNLEFAFPNKLFETVAAGAGVICGESKSMANLVRENQLGVVVPGWSAKALREAVTSISREQVEVFRQNASSSRVDLEWEKSRSTFLECLGLNR
jgi:hypothetical protein